MELVQYGVGRVEACCRYQGVDDYPVRFRQIGLKRELVRRMWICNEG
jgi:hypothetical protein